MTYEADLFLRTLGFHVDTKKSKKIQQNNYGFLSNLTWIGNRNMSLLLREYL